MRCSRLVRLNQAFVDAIEFDSWHLPAARPTAEEMDAWAAAVDAVGEESIAGNPEAASFWKRYPKPMVWKDPRFVQTLHLWPVWPASGNQGWAGVRV